MKYYYDTFPTSLGEFSVAANAEGAICFATFGGKKAFIGKGEFIHDPKAVASARKQLTEYFEGKRKKFDLTLAPQGTAFRQSVWSILRRIPLGETVTYGEIAKELGKPLAARAVGQAVGSNPLCPIIPCHRVLASGGALGGFYFGLPLKRRLLELEGCQKHGAGAG
jgi:methylated-DNA-[protein]-cysteine S-methyltransferase